MLLHLNSAATESFADTTQLDVAERVAAIIGDVRRDGDDAVRRYAEEFDGWSGPVRLDEGHVE